MSKISYEEQKKEIIHSFEFLENSIDKLAVKTYCHPYGGNYSFNDDTIKILNESGVLFSWNVDPRDIETSDLKNKKQALPRYDCNMFPHGQVRIIK